MMARRNSDGKTGSAVCRPSGARTPKVHSEQVLQQVCTMYTHYIVRDVCGPVPVS